MFEKLLECPLCSATNIQAFKAGSTHLNLDERFGVSRCHSCDLLFLSPRPSDDALHKIFHGKVVDGLKDYTAKPAGYGQVTESRRVLFRHRIKSVTTSYFNNEVGTLLDIGASSGVFLEEAEKQGWQAYGVEPSTAGTEALVQKGLQAKQAFAENLPFENNYFDWVHSNHVFEHLADPLAAAKEAQRVLKPGGLVFIEVPNQFDNIQFFRYRLMGRIPVRERNIRSIHHLFFFSRKTLRLLLEKAGFHDIEIRDYYGGKRKGLGALGSSLIRLMGKFYLGGPFIQAIARK